MAKRYEDLSRRALIQLGTDFDKDNDAELLAYLSEKSDDYEGIRPVEKVIARVDELKDVACGSASIVKATLMKEADKMLDTTMNLLVESAECLLKDNSKL